MGDPDEEELLKLSLATGDKKNKRKEGTAAAALCPLNFYEGFEGKMFHLLQRREHMLRQDCKSKGVVDYANGQRLVHLLLTAATAIDESNVYSAMEYLSELYQSVSLTGDSVQRVVAYFSDGLAARLLTPRSQFYDVLMKEPTGEEEFKAFTNFYRVSPYYQFAHFTANQAIIEAFENEEEINNRVLHVIDFDVSYGFQWPSLIQSLSEKASTGNCIYLRITGFGRNLEELQDTEARLVSFSKGFDNLVFEFQGLLRGTSALVNLRRKGNETLVVNLVFHLITLNKCFTISETLKFMRSLKPSIVVLVEQDGSNGSATSFLSRFMESLHYFEAMFDSLDDCLPLESTERLGIEKNLLGKEIKSLLNYYDMGCLSWSEYDMIETWKQSMENLGFAAGKISSKAIIQAKLLLKIRTHYCPLQFDGDSGGGGGGGFRVSERDEGRVISLAWQDRLLLTASAWHCL